MRGVVPRTTLTCQRLGCERRLYARQAVYADPIGGDEFAVFAARDQCNGQAMMEKFNILRLGERIARAAYDRAPRRRGRVVM
jgi:hypothetical protein